jgi:Carboxypeptidase regulatory-like domain
MAFAGISPRVFYRFFKKNRNTLCTVVVCLLTFPAGQLLYGQSTGSFSGTITDTTGSAVPGARVTATIPATGLTRSTTANGADEYIIPLLGVGIYNLQVENRFSKRGRKGRPPAGR